MEKSIRGDTLSGLVGTYLWSSDTKLMKWVVLALTVHCCVLNGGQLHDCFPVSILQSKEVGVQLQEDLMKVHNELYTVRHQP